MFKKKYLVAFFILQLVLLLGLSSTSLGLTSSEVETYTQQALNNYLQAQGWQSFNHAAAYGDLAGISYLLNQNSWAQKKQDIPFENYDSFAWNVWTEYASSISNSKYTNVSLYLFDNIDISISPGNTIMNSIPVNIINGIEENTNILAYQFRTPLNSDSFSFYQQYYSTIGINRNWKNYTTIFYTTGEIYNTQNLLFFGGKLNSVQPLDFQPHFVNTTTYKSTSVNYTIGDFYKINEVMLGTIIPNDAKLYNCYLYDGDIIIGAYTYNFYDNTQLYSNALRGNNNNVYCYTRYLDYNNIYNIEIEYYYENDDTLHIAHDNIVFFPQR